MKYYGNTHVGKVREENQDSFQIISVGDAVCATVCDGMGGVYGGKLASELALSGYHDYISSCLSEKDVSSVSSEELTDILVKAVGEAHKRVMAKARENEEYEGMGTTLVSAFVREGSAFVVNVGDSRCYCLNNDKLDKVTKDHSLVQEMVDSGMITEEEAENHPRKNCITRAVGIDYDMIPDVFYVPSFQQLLLCSDGLTNTVEINEIKKVLLDKINLKKAVDLLIKKANENGGYDNITIALIKEEL